MLTTPKATATTTHVESTADGSCCSEEPPPTARHDDYPYHLTATSHRHGGIGVLTLGSEPPGYLHVRHRMDNPIHRFVHQELLGTWKERRLDGAILQPLSMDDVDQQHTISGVGTCSSSGDVVFITASVSPKPHRWMPVFHASEALVLVTVPNPTSPADCQSHRYFDKKRREQLATLAALCVLKRKPVHVLVATGLKHYGSASESEAYNEAVSIQAARDELRLLFAQDPNLLVGVDAVSTCKHLPDTVLSNREVFLRTFDSAVSRLPVGLLPVTSMNQAEQPQQQQLLQTHYQHAVSTATSTPDQPYDPYQHSLPFRLRVVGLLKGTKQIIGVVEEGFVVSGAPLSDVEPLTSGTTTVAAATLPPCAIITCVEEWLDNKHCAPPPKKATFDAKKMLSEAKTAMLSNVAKHGSRTRMLLPTHTNYEVPNVKDRVIPCAYVFGKGARIVFRLSNSTVGRDHLRSGMLFGNAAGPTRQLHGTYTALCRILMPHGVPPPPAQSASLLHNRSDNGMGQLTSTSVLQVLGDTNYNYLSLTSRPPSAAVKISDVVDPSLLREASMPAWDESFLMTFSTWGTAPAEIHRHGCHHGRLLLRHENSTRTSKFLAALATGTTTSTTTSATPYIIVEVLDKWSFMDIHQELLYKPHHKDQLDVGLRAHESTLHRHLCNDQFGIQHLAKKMWQLPSATSVSGLNSSASFHSPAAVTQIELLAPYPPKYWERLRWINLTKTWDRRDDEDGESSDDDSEVSHRHKIAAALTSHGVAGVMAPLNTKRHNEQQHLSSTLLEFIFNCRRNNTNGDNDGSDPALSQEVVKLALESIDSAPKLNVPVRGPWSTCRQEVDLSTHLVTFAHSLPQDLPDNIVALSGAKILELLITLNTNRALFLDLLRRPALRCTVPNWSTVYPLITADVFEAIFKYHSSFFHVHDSSCSAAAKDKIARRIYMAVMSHPHAMRRGADSFYNPTLRIRWDELQREGKLRTMPFTEVFFYRWRALCRNSPNTPPYTAFHPLAEYPPQVALRWEQLVLSSSAVKLPDHVLECIFSYIHWLV